jgi:hypothetical protein
MKVKYKWEKWCPQPNQRYALTLYLTINKIELQPPLAVVRKGRGDKWVVTHLLGEDHPEDYTDNATLMGPYDTLRETKQRVEKKIKEIIRRL